jgi:hypothetical protein
MKIIFSFFIVIFLLIVGLIGEVILNLFKEKQVEKDSFKSSEAEVQLSRS